MKSDHLEDLAECFCEGAERAVNIWGKKTEEERRYYRHKTLDLLRLKDILEEPENPVTDPVNTTCHSIIRTAFAVCGIDYDRNSLAHRRSATLVTARRAASWLCRYGVHPMPSMPEIAAAFGGTKHHTTIHYHIYECPEREESMRVVREACALLNISFMDAMSRMKEHESRKRPVAQNTGG